MQFSVLHFSFIMYFSRIDPEAPPTHASFCRMFHPGRETPGQCPCKTRTSRFRGLAVSQLGAPSPPDTRPLGLSWLCLVPSPCAHTSEEAGQPASHLQVLPGTHFSGSRLQGPQASSPKNSLPQPTPAAGVVVVTPGQSGTLIGPW